MSAPAPEQKHVFEEGRRGGIAGFGDRLRAQRSSKTRLQWREMSRKQGEGRCPASRVGSARSCGTFSLDSCRILEPGERHLQLWEACDPEAG